MNDAEAETKRLELIEVLKETSQLLHAYNEGHWSGFLQESRQLIADRNFRGLDQVFHSFGGMGSFNDLFIHPVNRHLIAETGVSAAHAQLEVLKSRIWGLVGDLRRYELGR
jgi:hypothetical protein